MGMRAVGWLATPLFSDLFKKASSFLSFDESKKLKDLEPKLLLLERVTEAVQENPHRPRLEQLLKDLKSAFYEAEDILDDVEYHRLERQIKDNKNNSDSDASSNKRDRVKKMLKSAMPSNPLKNQECGMSKCQLKKSLDKIENAINDAYQILKQLNLPIIDYCDGRQDFPSNSRSTVTCGAPPPKVFGRDEECDKIIAMLHEKDCEQNYYSLHSLLTLIIRFKFCFLIFVILTLQYIFFSSQYNLFSSHYTSICIFVLISCASYLFCIFLIPVTRVRMTNKSECGEYSDLRYSVLGIYGIAGSGKSTLAQLVYAHEKKDKQDKKDGHFDLVIWVHISHNFDLDAILRGLMEGATGNSCPHFSSRNTLQEILEEKLHGKRIFLVLDDVWNNWNLEELQQLLSPLNSGQKGSKILVTSRSRDALLALGAVQERCIAISDLDDNAFFQMFMHYALPDARIHDNDRVKLKMIGEDIAKKLKRSPLAARTVGAQLCIRLNVEFWMRTKERDLLNDTMGALWWSYRNLDVHIRRCFAYCTIYPKRRLLKRKELVQLWTAEGFIKTTNAKEDLDDIGQKYFDELLSASFLQLAVRRLEQGCEVDYFIVHDLLRDLAEEVVRGDCFRIEKGFTGEVSPDIRHLFVGSIDRKMLVEKIFELQNLRTLIFHDPIPHDDEVFNGMFRWFPKLRVLVLSFTQDIVYTLSVPVCIGQLKHLRILNFDVSLRSRLILPGSITDLYNIQVLGMSDFNDVVFSSSKNMNHLVNLRCISSNSDFDIPHIGRLKWLQSLTCFRVLKKQGYELRQLKDLNKLEGSLGIRGLENVESKEAIEARLADKERITELSLTWNDTSCSPEVEAEVLEGLCPSKYLEMLHIRNYHGSRYPDWMVSKQEGGPNNLYYLMLYICTRVEPAPELFEVFIHLRWFRLWSSNWHYLPDTMERLASLRGLEINRCLNIRSLPALPRSLKMFVLRACNEEFMRSCKTIGDPNWQKIQHIREIYIRRF